MPHTKKGAEVKVGDVVYIPARVTAIQPENDRCNCSLESVHLMPGWDTPNTFTLNCQQVQTADEVSDDRPGHH